MDVLKLLERIEWGDDSRCPNENCLQWKYNPDSGDVNEHYDDCQLKAAIDALRSGRLRVITVTEEAIKKAQTEFAENKIKTGWSTSLEGVRSHWLSGVKWALKQKDGE